MDIFKKIKKVSQITVYPPILYFTGLLIGLFLHFICPLDVGEKKITPFIGIFLIIFATFLILWAQKTARNFNKSQNEENPTGHGFHKGPYNYTRNPTYLGLTMMILGFGFIVQSFWIIIINVIPFAFTYFLFLKKEEKLLEKKHGGNYLKYKKSVKSWL